MMSDVQWEGYYDRHAWFDNGLHLRVTRIDPPKEDFFWMWTVYDPMVRVPVGSSTYEMGLDKHTQDLDEAQRQCIEAAKRVKPYGG